MPRPIQKGLQKDMEKLTLSRLQKNQSFNLRRKYIKIKKEPACKTVICYNNECLIMNNK